MTHLDTFTDMLDTMDLPYDLIKRSGAQSDVVIPPMNESSAVDKVHFTKYVFDENEAFVKIQIASYIHQTEIERGSG